MGTTRISLIVAASMALGSPATGEELSLKDVIESVAKHNPKIVAAKANVDRAQGDRLAAGAAFEPKIKAKGGAILDGYYDYTTARVAIEQRVPHTGVTVSGGFRRGVGDFPVYYGDRETLSQGEAFAELRVPLVKDLMIDEQRAGLRKAQLGQDIALAQRQQVWLATAEEAAVAYFEWVAAARLLQVARDLLAIATTRRDTVLAQAEAGGRPRIEAVDAEQLFLARETAVRKAEQSLIKARNKLSLYYRDDNGKPIRVPTTRAPKSIPLPKIDSTSRTDLTAEQLPLLQELSLTQELAQIDERVANNSRLPSVDVVGFVSRDIGNGSDTLRPTEVGVGVMISIPLLQREGRGKAQAARAKRRAARAKAQFVAEAIRADYDAARVGLNLALQRVELAKRRLNAAEALAEAERTKFARGGANLLDIAIRENSVGSAARSVIEAERAARLAYVRWRATQGKTALPQ